MDRGVVDQLVAAERMLLCPGPDADVEALLGPDFVEIGASGRRWTRDDAVELVAARRGRDPADVELSEVACRALGETKFLLTYAIRTRGRTSRRASIWDGGDGQWRMVYHQGTYTD